MGRIDGDGFDWRNHYGDSSSDDRRLKIGRNVEMSDIGTAENTTVTWTTTCPGDPVAWVGLQEPLSLFVISLEDDTELLVSAHGFDEAWRIASARIAKQVMRQTGARAVEMPRDPENITWIPLPTQPQLLHVFEGKAEEPLALFIVTLVDGTEFLTAAQSREAAWNIAIPSGPDATMRLLESTLEISLPDTPGLLHVFMGKAEE